MLSTFLQIIYVLTAIALIAFVLIQQPKSSGMGSLGGGGGGGGGASSTVFGAKGAGNFLYKSTRALAFVLFISAVALGYALNKEAHSDNVFDRAVNSAKKDSTPIDVPSAKEDNAKPASNTDIPSASN